VDSLAAIAYDYGNREWMKRRCRVDEVVSGKDELAGCYRKGF
jgi:hypothetical protein